MLTGNQQPDHSRISEFRRRNLDALKGLFIQILRLCQKAWMVSLGHVALDGTKVQANASNRMFFTKAPQIWTDGSDRDHLAYVAEVLTAQGWLGGKGDPLFSVIALKPSA